MRDTPLPPELNRWSTNADLRYRGNNEWSSACPYCNPAGRGGHNPSDRFRMFSTGGPPRGWCRQCDRKVIAASDGRKPTTEEIESARKKYHDWLIEENKRLREKVKWLQEQNFWRRWHETMGDAVDLWREAGISDTLIDAHQLGYTIEKYMDFGGALTLPYLKGGEIQSLQYRLLLPPEKGDKYRFELGTKATWFYAWPYDEMGDVVLVAEGAKKAMVLWQTIARLPKFTFHGSDITVVATPSKYVPNRMLDELENVEQVIWLLDPDAYDAPGPGQLPPLYRNAKAVGPDKCRHIRLPTKIDDMILANKHDMHGKRIQHMVNQAAPIIMPNSKRRATTRFL